MNMDQTIGYNEAIMDVCKILGAKTRLELCGCFETLSKDVVDLLKQLPLETPEDWDALRKSQGELL